ncbi:MAG: tol-pal system protein YbgF [Deltaproteobacteria bacterium]|nr:tol-pal system protein YbgF [Deltaproteobacteria bacterium]
MSVRAEIGNFLINTRNNSAIAALILVSGCGAASASPAVAAAGAKTQNNSQRERALQEQAERVSELEIRIAMLESSMREIRAEISRRNRESRGETIRIGRSSNQKPYVESAREEQHENREYGFRPVLRLHDNAKNAITRAEPFVLPEAPPSIQNNLSVVPLPSTDAHGRVPTIEKQARKRNARVDSAVIGEYRAALALVRQRQYDQALNALSTFIVNNPSSSYLDSAIYWRGEVYYARREYQQALNQFQTVSTRFPASRKLPDALLKTGMCYQRLGDNEQARGLFQRVRSQFPNSKAARIASLESSS